MGRHAQIERMVLGFAFTPDNRVALIRKRRPSWQAGKLNGIGGHREPREEGLAAMEREFFKETGVRIPASMWETRGTMQFPKRWHVMVYSVVDPRIEQVRTQTDEEVVLVDAHEARSHTPMHNLEALISACMMRPDHVGVTPTFNLLYY